MKFSDYLTSLKLLEALAASWPPLFNVLSRWKEKTLNEEGCFWSSCSFTARPLTSLHQTVLYDGNTAAAGYYVPLRSYIKMSSEVRHGATTYRIHDRSNPERESGGIPGCVAPGSTGMKRMGPIHKVPLKRRSYTNRDWHEERRQVVFTYTGSFVSSTKGHYADSVLWK